MYIENNSLKNKVTLWLIIMFFLVSLMIIVGGLTRLTDSGLSITKWELFEGFFPPINDSEWLNYFNQYKQIPEFKIQNFSMTLNEFKIIFWWEWSHRFMGRVVGILYLLPLIYFSFYLKFKNLINLYLIFILICFQGFLGWYMVSSGLVNNIDVSHFRLSIHLITAFVILSLILWNLLCLKSFTLKKQNFNIYFSIVFIILIFIQIAIGAFVAGMDAGKIYNSWPLMGESYFPDDNLFINLLAISAFYDPSLVQFMHRNFAYFIVLFYLFLLFIIFNKKLNSLYFPIILIGVILIFQVILGILTLISGASIILASMHQISSIFLVSSAIYFFFINVRSNQQLSN